MLSTRPSQSTPQRHLPGAVADAHRRLEAKAALLDHVQPIDGRRGWGASAWIEAHWPLIVRAPGSRHNHQAWDGGFLDHTLQLMACVDALLPALESVAPLPPVITRASAKLVLLFHDVEKVFRYAGVDPVSWDKDTYLTRHLREHWHIAFTEAELNALTYVHGEGDDYAKDRRVMNPLAAFCHTCDVTSARIWFDQGAPGDREDTAR